MKKFYQLLALKVLLMAGLFTIMAIQGWSMGFMFLAVYVLLVGLYINRQKRGVTMKGVNNFFRLYTWAWVIILILIIVFSIVSGGYFSGYYYVLSLSYIVPAIGEIIVDIYPTLIIFILLIGLLKINNKFIPLAERKKRHINKKLILVISAIILVGMFNWLTWDHAYTVEGQIYDIYGAGPENEQIVIMQANRYFDKAFKEIIIFDSFIFISTFLLLYVWKKDDNSNS